MVTLNGNTGNMLGESTDEKPTNVEVNTLFLELDSGVFFYFDGEEWKRVGES